MKPTSRIRLNNIRKWQAQSNSHERITSLSFRKKTRNSRLDRPENKTPKGRFYTDLQDCAQSKENCSDELQANENKILRTEHNNNNIHFRSLVS